MTHSAFDRHNQRQREYFEARQKRTMLPTDTPYIQRHLDELLAFGNVSRGERILEVGCGPGRYTLPLAARGFNLEGLDLSPVLLDRLRAYAGRTLDIPLHCGDVAVPPPHLEAKFDAVIGFFTLHHLHDLSASFQGMSCLLKPRGRVVFLEPNPWNPLYYLQIALTPGMSWRGDGGIVRMTPGRVFSAMKAVGLGDGDVKRFGFFPPVVANTTAGAELEHILEAFPPWRSLLPFQLFKGTLPVG